MSSAILRRRLADYWYNANIRKRVEVLLVVIVRQNKRPSVVGRGYNVMSQMYSVKSATVQAAAVTRTLGKVNVR
jgi:hypothetical protein